MKYLMQLSILLLVWALGEAVSAVLHPFIAIPGAIMGMLILFLLLLSGIIKEEHIKETSDFLLNNIAFFFVPAGIGIMSLVTDKLFILILVGIISTIVTMFVTMFITTLLTKGGH